MEQLINIKQSWWPRDITKWKAYTLLRLFPVAKSVIVRILLAIVASQNWHLHELDIKNAFLHGHSKEEIYMEAPEGYSVPKDNVCKLKRSLYGLKRASREHGVHKQIEDFGLSESNMTTVLQIGLLWKLKPTLILFSLSKI
ncbi:UNVERIFIED_CONTAM: hypothetical protein Sradi_5421900 [Sesamum radiatum]|uniref:Reverse transcriptase Ty1/copia-type domain-containing protein n=1 Tax=Sesamum radiatum TaxID=300843 RepID=A0AAW2L7V8_SESRA